ncbi:MAG TPA: MOSC domain-containing protein [Actinomycetota bacterium]|nr:MOSC domain-containing protein [Actinomycetota bacterium]
MASGQVVSLQVKRGHWRPLEPIASVEATSRGLDGDKHAGREGGKRQVLLTDEDDLRDLDLKPGDLREQVTLRLPGLMSLAAGTRLEIGGAVLELTGRCEPCTHIGEHLERSDREAFRDRLRGRRGMLARVAVPGRIEVGDPVRSVPA